MAQREPQTYGFGNLMSGKLNKGKQLSHYNGTCQGVGYQAAGKKVIS